MKPFHKYSNKDELLKDLASFEANILNKNPDLPKKEKILKIYRYIANQFENKPISDPASFTKDAIFRLALDLDSETPEGLEKINKIVNEEAYLTRGQLFLLMVVANSITTCPMMKSLNKNMESERTYLITVSEYSSWMLHNIYGITSGSERADISSQYSQWFFYCNVILSIERRGNGNIDKALDPQHDLGKEFWKEEAELLHDLCKKLENTLVNNFKKDKGEETHV